MNGTGSVVITGASGLLGRALMTKFQESGLFEKVIGTALNRANGCDTVKLDLTDTKQTTAFIQRIKPRVLIHAAAQRFPDKVEEDYEAAQRLNVESTKVIAHHMSQIGGWMVYISTDYVFDGTNPPYREDATTGPLNKYGVLKRQGEVATLEADPNHGVLRIPILYGPVEYLAESAVTVLYEKLKKLQESKGDERMTVSDYEIRRPSHVNDIATICQKLVEQKFKNPGETNGIYHWCGCEALTKYNMVESMASVFGLDIGKVIGDAKPPAQGGAKRPYDTTLACTRLTELGIEAHTPFRDGISDSLKSWT